MPPPLRFTVNDRPVEVVVEPGLTLLRVLREQLGLTGAKDGCGIGRCGACTVILDGRLVRACRVMAESLPPGASVTTIEGLAKGDDLHPIQRAFIRAGAVQCGFCTPGMVLTAKALLDRHVRPTRGQIRDAFKGNLCRCTGYEQIFRAVEMAASGHVPPEPPARVGESVSRPEAAARVTGREKYTADLSREGALHGAVLRSARAHARLLRIDADAARRAPGVVRVFTHEDVPAGGDKNFGRARKDQPVLAYDRVRFMGDAVALIVAETRDAARAALHLIRVEYEPLPGVFSADAALADGAPLIHEAGNVAHRQQIRKGDVDAAFVSAPIVIENTYRTQHVEHACLEPEAATAYWEGDTLVVEAPSQNVFFDRFEIARTLGLDKSQVRVVRAPTGGAFGKREDLCCQIHAALAAFYLKRPVKIVLSREESHLATTKRHPFTIRYRTAADLSGKLLAVDVDIVADAGAYTSWAPNILRKATVHACGPYEVPNVRVTAAAVHTNRANSGAMRGFGATQLAFAYERQMDALARKLSMDPLDLRMSNALRVGSVTGTGQELKSSVGLIETMQRCAERFGWAEFNRRQQGDWQHGRGMASIFYGIGYGNGIPDIGAALVELRPDGGFDVRTGAVDYGQGSTTIFAQIVAHEMGLPMDRVRVIAADSAHTPDSGSTVASRQTYVTGGALVKACEGFKRDAAKLISEQTGAPADAVRIGEGGATWPGGRMSYEELFALFKGAGKLPARNARFKADTGAIDLETGQGPCYWPYAFATQMVEVAVNRETGEVRVERVVAAHDVGKAINPDSVRGQVYGGVMMGLGYALMEDYRTEEGKPQSLNFDTYRIPRSTDVPEIDVILVEDPEPTGPYGAKGVGEPAMLPTAPAILNAIQDAGCGALTDLPADASANQVNDFDG